MVPIVFSFGDGTGGRLFSEVAATRGLWRPIDRYFSILPDLHDRAIFRHDQGIEFCDRGKAMTFGFHWIARDIQGQPVKEPGWSSMWNLVGLTAKGRPKETPWDVCESR